MDLSIFKPSVRNAIIATHLKCKIIYWNKYTENLLGWRVEDVLSKPVNNIIISPVGRSQTGGIRNQIDQKDYWEGEHGIQRKDGTIITVYATISALIDFTGKYVDSIGNSTDITERMREESDLQFIRNAMES